MNQDVNNLELTIAEFFPDEYSPDTWQQLVTRYIAAQMDIYPVRVEDHKREHAEWEQLGSAGPEPTYPMFPMAFAQACAEEMRQQDFDYVALAASLRLLGGNYKELEQSNEVLEESNEKLAQLVRDSAKINLQLIDEVKRLNERVRSLEWHNTLLSDTNEFKSQQIKRYEDGTRLGDWLN